MIANKQETQVESEHRRRMTSGHASLTTASGLPLDSRSHPSVLIGPLSSDRSESVSSVNRAFLNGLSDRYNFLSLDATRTRGNTRQTALNLVNAFYLTQQMWRWLAQLYKHRPDVAHYAISSGWAMEKGLLFLKLARMFGVKALGHLHSGGFIDHWRRLPRWRKQWAAREFQNLDGLVLASPWWRDEIGKHVPIPPERLFVVNNPIDEAFEQAALRMPRTQGRNVVLALGVMGRAKGVFDILAAAALAVEKAEFTLVLAGSEREPNILNDLRAQVEKQSMTRILEIRSVINDHEKEKLFEQATIFLLPSYYENFPLVLVEAAAAGLAIITTPVGAVPEFFQDGVSARFVEAGNVAQISAVLTELVNEPEERLRLGSAAREMFRQRLTRVGIMASLDRVYLKILGQ